MMFLQPSAENVAPMPQFMEWLKGHGGIAFNVIAFPNEPTGENVANLRGLVRALTEKNVVSTLCLLLFACKRVQRADVWW